MDDLTDREALEQLIARFGLQPYTGTDDRVPHVEPPDAHEVVLAAKAGGVGGYNGFQARFNFDTDGKFESLEIWE